MRHSRGQYEIEVTDLQDVLSRIGEGDCVVTDKNVRDAVGLESEHFAIEPGEQSKSLEVYSEVLDWLADRASRSSRLIALGGGVVGDLAGFCAATFMRGVELVQVPTSLLAMVDSSVGGKVGIDLPKGKNLAGSFWPPSAVWVPIDALKTLPDRHFINGSAEVWKYAFVMCPELYERLRSRPLEAGHDDIDEIVTKCIDLKRQVVEEDEHETTGRRAILNFGHTVGHAVEQALGYKGLLHGEAISIGMVVEARLAERLGVAEKGLSDEISVSLKSQGLPTSLEEKLDPDDLIGAMARDKKADRNGLAFSLVSSIGTCKLYTSVDEGAVRQVLEEM